MQESRPHGEGPNRSELERILYSTALIMLRKLYLSYKPLTTKGFAHNSQAELFNELYVKVVFGVFRDWLGILV